jgi:hypothetical protein
VIASTVTFTAVATVEDFRPAQFKTLQSRALGVSESSVVVTSVTPGSIIVDYYIQPEGVMTSFDDQKLSAIVATLAEPPRELTDAFGPAVVSANHFAEPGLSAARRDSAVAHFHSGAQHSMDVEWDENADQRTNQAFNRCKPTPSAAPAAAHSPTVSDVGDVLLPTRWSAWKRRNRRKR